MNVRERILGSIEGQGTYWVLVHELITWEAEDDKLILIFSLFGDFLVELLKTFILRCETAL